MVGRGLRLSPESGKEDCYILDIEDNISKASGMRVDPTLFGLSYEDGAARQASLSELSGRANESEEDDSRPGE
jgi:ATP-dependent helicase IRC3